MIPSETLKLQVCIKKHPLNRMFFMCGECGMKLGVYQDSNFNKIISFIITPTVFANIDLLSSSKKPVLQKILVHRFN